MSGRRGNPAARARDAETFPVRHWSRSGNPFPDFAPGAFVKRPARGWSLASLQSASSKYAARFADAYDVRAEALAHWAYDRAAEALDRVAGFGPDHPRSLIRADIEQRLAEYDAGLAATPAAPSRPSVVDTLPPPKTGALKTAPVSSPFHRTDPK